MHAKAPSAVNHCGGGGDADTVRVHTVEKQANLPVCPLKEVTDALSVPSTPGPIQKKNCESKSRNNEESHLVSSNPSRQSLVTNVKIKLENNDIEKPKEERLNPSQVRELVPIVDHETNGHNGQKIERFDQEKSALSVIEDVSSAHQTNADKVETLERESQPSVQQSPAKEKTRQASENKSSEKDELCIEKLESGIRERNNQNKSRKADENGRLLDRDQYPGREGISQVRQRMSEQQTTDLAKLPVEESSNQDQNKISENYGTGRDLILPANRGKAGQEENRFQEESSPIVQKKLESKEKTNAVNSRILQNDKSDSNYRHRSREHKDSRWSQTEREPEKPANHNYSSRAYKQEYYQEKRIDKYKARDNGHPVEDGKGYRRSKLDSQSFNHSHRREDKISREKQHTLDFSGRTLNKEINHSCQERKWERKRKHSSSENGESDVDKKRKKLLCDPSLEERRIKKHKKSKKKKASKDKRRERDHKHQSLDSSEVNSEADERKRRKKKKKKKKRHHNDKDVHYHSRKHQEIPSANKKSDILSDSERIHKSTRSLCSEDRIMHSHKQQAYEENKVSPKAKFGHLDTKQNSCYVDYVHSKEETLNVHNGNSNRHLVNCVGSGSLTVHQSDWSRLRLENGSDQHKPISKQDKEHFRERHYSHNYNKEYSEKDSRRDLTSGSSFRDSTRWKTGEKRHEEQKAH